MAVKRIWHGWTTPANADRYQSLLLSEVFGGIEAMAIPGYRAIEVMRRDLEDEVEFVTIMTFDGLENVVAFQGEDYDLAYVPQAAQRLLKRWDPRSAHYETIESRSY